MLYHKNNAPNYSATLPILYHTMYMHFKRFRFIWNHMTIPNNKIYNVSVFFSVKVPQIQKVVSAKSAAGLSFLGLLFEIFAVTSMFAYSLAKGFPFRWVLIAEMFVK